MTTKKTTRRKPADSTNGELVDGTLTIAVKGGPYDGQTLEMDALVVRLAAETLVRKHGLKVKDGWIDATAAFSVDLDKALKEVGYKSTPTIAIRAWEIACRLFAELQKKTNPSPS